MWISVAVADDGPPGFVYGILVTIFLAFNCFALNQWLQYRQALADYAHGETVYIWLSLIAKSLLAWQIWVTPHRIVSGEGRPACSRHRSASGSLELGARFSTKAATPSSPSALAIALVIIAASNSPAVSKRGVDAVVDHPLRFAERRRGALCEGRGQLDGGGVDIVVGDNPIDQPPGPPPRRRGPGW